MNRVLTKEMQDYFLANYLKESGNDMAKRFGVSNSVVKGVLQKHKIIVLIQLVIQ